MRRWLCWPLLAAGLLAVDTARGHALGLSQGEYRLQEGGLTVDLVFARAELGERPALLAERLLHGIAVSDERGQACTGALTRRELDDSSLTLSAAYRCAAPALRVDVRFWDELAPGHRHLARQATELAETAPTLLQREQAHLELAAEPRAPAPTSSSLLGWLRLGVEHILAGYDHLAFLLGLVLVASTLRRLAGLVSLFTLAHSLTLALASLDLYAPPSSLVEAAIAASICYVGLENLTGRTQRKRAALVFGSGLIHGFGFAGALRELGVRSSESPLALLGFNLGVELGQLALLAAVFPVLQRARQLSWFQRRGLLLLNVAVALAGAGWLATRVLESGAFAG